MATKEEIGEGLDELFYEMGLGETITREDFRHTILTYLASQGVVIKKDGEFPDIDVEINYGGGIWGAIRKEGMVKSGYTLYDPLV